MAAAGVFGLLPPKRPILTKNGLYLGQGVELSHGTCTAEKSVRRASFLLIITFHNSPPYLRYFQKTRFLTLLWTPDPPLNLLGFFPGENSMGGAYISAPAESWGPTRVHDRSSRLKVGPRKKSSGSGNPVRVIIRRYPKWPQIKGGGGGVTPPFPPA